jgi:hypothetical protein
MRAEYGDLTRYRVITPWSFTVSQVADPTSPAVTNWAYAATGRTLSFRLSAPLSGVNPRRVKVTLTGPCVGGVATDVFDSSNLLMDPRPGRMFSNYRLPTGAPGTGGFDVALPLPPAAGSGACNAAVRAENWSTGVPATVTTMPWPFVIP